MFVVSRDDREALARPEALAQAINPFTRHDGSNPEGGELVGHRSPADAELEASAGGVRGLGLIDVTPAGVVSGNRGHERPGSGCSAVLATLSG